MYQAIVFLPLLGFFIAGAIAVFGARARHPGGYPPPGEHATHAVADAHAHVAPAPHGDAADAHAEADEPEATGSRTAEVVTTAFLFISMALSWIAFARVGFGQHDARDVLFPFIVSGEVTVDWTLRVDTLTAVMLVVVTTVSAVVHLYSIG